MKLFLRLHAECPSFEAATMLHERLQVELSRWNPEVHAGPQQYWKMPEYYEFTFTLRTPTPQAHNGIRLLAREGWHDMHSEEELSSIWNRGCREKFLVPEVVWAELALSP